jgi:hypothetical protein
LHFVKAAMLALILLQGGRFSFLTLWKDWFTGVQKKKERRTTHPASRHPTLSLPDQFWEIKSYSTVISRDFSLNRFFGVFFNHEYWDS